MISPVYVCVWRSGFWFRIFGYGLAVRRETDFGLLFSERNGYARVFRVGGWIVKPIDPSSLRGV